MRGTNYLPITDRREVVEDEVGRDENERTTATREKTTHDIYSIRKTEKASRLKRRSEATSSSTFDGARVPFLRDDPFLPLQQDNVIMSRFGWWATNSPFGVHGYGDGRAMSLGEFRGFGEEKSWELQLKG